MSSRELILSGLGLALLAPAVIVSAATPSAARGKALARAQGCLMCHASGGMAKPLSRYAGDSAGQLKKAILNPKKTLGPSTMMPSYEAKVSPAELDALVAFIKAG